MKTSTFSQPPNLLGEGGMQKPLLRTVLGLRARVLGILGRLDWLALLLGRLAVGLLFVSTGWGKVHDIPKVTRFFESLHIPAPGFHAVLVGYSELLCGTALVIGLLSRLATIPLIVSMVVAILTAKAADIHGIFDLVGADEFTYLVVLVMIAVLGPGGASIDALIARRLDASSVGT
jgi:putative oxidoreductase